MIDDNSPDGTGQWCDEQRAADPRIACLHRPGKLGLGTATIAGMKYAIEHGYQFVLNMDADFSHQPKYLPALLGRHGPAGRAAGRRDDRLALHARRRRRGLAAETPADEPRRESLRPLAAGAAAQGLQRGVPLLSHRAAWPSSISTPCAAAAIRSRKKSSGV